MIKLLSLWVLCGVLFCGCQSQSHTSFNTKQTATREPFDTKQFPILVWRTAPTAQSEHQLLAVSPMGEYTTVVTIRNDDDGVSHTLPKWTTQPQVFAFWEMRESRPEIGHVGAISNGRKFYCLDRYLNGDPFSQVYLPIQAEDTRYFLLEPHPFGGVGQINVLNCQIQAIASRKPLFEQEQSLLVTSYCQNKKLWAAMNGLSQIYDANWKPVVENVGLDFPVFSPDCNRLIGYDVKGWYLLEASNWVKRHLLIAKNLSMTRPQDANLSDGRLFVSPPSWSPDQKYFVYSIYRKYDELDRERAGAATTYIVDIDTKTERILLENAAYPDWHK